MTEPTCGRLVAVSLSPPEMTECGLPPEHDGQCIPYTKLKRQVSYNQDAILCPICKKRIRLNNDGRVRVHMVGKVGSGRCSNSDAYPEGYRPLLAITTFADVEDSVAATSTRLFSDPA